MAYLLHAHHEAVVHCCAILLGALAQVVVQHLHVTQVPYDPPQNRDRGRMQLVICWVGQKMSVCSTIGFGNRACPGTQPSGTEVCAAGPFRASG